MKKLFVAATVFVCWLAAPTARAVTVAPGSPLVLSFSHLPFVGRNDAFFQSGAGIRLAGDLLDFGDNIRVEFFENSLADLTFYQDINSDTWPVPTDNFGVGLAFHASPTPWVFDLQGVVRLTALSGSINVDQISVGVVKSLGGNIGGQFAETFDFPSVPLPAALPLFAGGLGLIGLLACRRKLFVAVTVFVCCLGSPLAGGARAAIVNIEYTGVVGAAFNIFNYNGPFTNHPYYLQSYTADYVFNTTPADTGSLSVFTPTQNYVYGGSPYGPGVMGPALSASINIGTSTFTIPLANSFYNAIQGANNGSIAIQLHHVKDATGNVVLVNIIDSFVPGSALPASIDTAFTYSVTSNDSSGGNYCDGVICYTLFPQKLTETLSDSAVPLPAALPLFATGLGALGLIGWRRKRKVFSDGRRSIT